MQEVLRPLRQQERPGPGGLGSIFGGGDAPNGMATVTSGTHVESLPVGGMTVGEIRRRFRDRLDLAPNSQATVDGRDATDQTVVRAGQLVDFIRPGGEKGAA